MRPGRLPSELSSLEQATLYETDLTERDQLSRAVEDAAPDLVFHLAAQSSVAQSWQDPEGTILNNVLGQLHLLEVLRQQGRTPRVLIVSSNEVYGAPAGPEELPLKETSPLRPNNPYAVSKVAQDMMGYQYFLSHGLPIVRVRPFNHIGPGQSDAFVASAFARQIAEAEAGLREPVIQVGNLEAMRDFTDVRDMMRGYYLAISRGQPGEVYNLGSQRATSVQRLLDIFLARSRVSVDVRRDPERYRPVDVPCVYADCSKFREATGWRPTIPLEQTLADVLEYWRAHVMGK